MRAVPSGESTLTFAADGKSGTYIQDVPFRHNPDRPTPVVFDLHGYVEPASLEHIATGLGAYGDRHGFVTITPQITESGVARWDDSAHSRDVAWIGSLLAHLESYLCLDERRVYVTGLSMGAFTASAIACELSEKVAAVAPVAGLQAYPWCKPSRPVPVVAFQGTADPFVAFTGGPGPGVFKLPLPGGGKETIGQYVKDHPGALKGPPLPQSIPDQVATWAKRNGCAVAPARTRVAYDVILYTYRCSPDASVDFYVILGGGHTWPGRDTIVSPVAIVGRTTTSISADAIMWRFFLAHPLTGPLG